MDELKPCPFCGVEGDPDINKSSLAGPENRWKFGVYCNVCFCEGPPGKTKEEAGRRWNERAVGGSGRGEGEQP